nr:hypothetical protein BaRGS_017723 [Batillaria attramentaria]
MRSSSVALVWLSALLTAAEAVNTTVQMKLSQHWDNNFEGSFCYQLPDVILGYMLVAEFNPPVKELQNWVGDYIEGGSREDCASKWVLVNQDIHGLQKAGEFCIRMAGKICTGSGDFTATGTLVDLTVDSQVPPTPVTVSGAQDMKYNYAEVVQKSLLFYYAQRSGKLPPDNPIPWRGDSALHDHGANGEDLSGGWYDAGDNIKFNYPMAFSTTVLCWSLLEFRDAYSQAGQLENMYDTIRWTLEYFVKCHTKPNELYVQVGDAGRDHGTWTSPERMDESLRTSYKIDPSRPGSDIADETAAAMACGYMAFKEKDPTFADTLLEHSKQLYEFAKAHPSFYSNSVSEAAAYYRSYNYTDELTWGAMWLYRAVGGDNYLQDAEATYLPGAAWGFSWDEKNNGNMLGIKPDEYRQWAMCQINYALGDTGRSYVVGFGTNPPTRPHHRARSIVSSRVVWSSVVSCL